MGKQVVLEVWRKVTADKIAAANVLSKNLFCISEGAENICKYIYSSFRLLIETGKYKAK